MVMNLEDWLRENDITVTDFAQKIGVKGAKSVYRYINRERIPDREIMPRIIEATNGQVTPNSFYQ